MEHIIRDPVHHTIPLSLDERRVIDHPLFQRLRRVKQTAFLHLVFPGATHDRFSHSIGAMHMAGLVFDSIAEDFIKTYGPRSLMPNQREYLRRLLRLTALLHDVGHGPFSHSIEGVSHAGRPIHPTKKRLLEEGDIPNHWVDEKGPAQKPAWLAELSMHEEFTLDVLAKMSDNSGRIGGVLAQDIAALMCSWIVPSQEFEELSLVGPSAKWSVRTALKSLISGELDVDRMDYLLRDSHYTGVPYGKYDKDMLLDNLILRPRPSDDGKKLKKSELVLCLRRKALHAFEDFLMARFHMFMQLYSHKTAVSFDVILENALAELPDFQIEPDLKDYLTWSEDWLLRKILENRSSRWGAHIRDRKPLKLLFTVRQEDQKAFKKFIAPYEMSAGTTAWFPSLKNRMTKASETRRDIPKIWWRHCVSYLTREERGSYPLFLENRRELIPIENVSLLLKSDYSRRLDFVHVYCLREEEDRVVPWLLKEGIPEAIFRKPEDLTLR